jgi:hypothetical protein
LPVAVVQHSVLGEEADGSDHGGEDSRLTGP